MPGCSGGARTADRGPAVARGAPLRHNPPRVSADLARRIDLALLALALLAALAAGLQDLDAPWENGFKGTNGGAYTYRFLQHHLELGLPVTRGGNVTGLELREGGRPIVYPNHPATYTLLHLGPAALCGLSEAVVRLVALLLWLPAIPALWSIARRVLGAPAAGLAALLLACTPMTAYYGPMAVPDGALLACFLLTSAAFLAQAAQPTPRGGRLLAAAFCLALLLDWSALWLAPLLLALWPLAADRRAARRALVRLALLAPLPVAALFAHTALVRGGLVEAAQTWGGLFGFSQQRPPGWAELGLHEAQDALALFGAPLLLLASAGVLAGLLAPRALAPGPALLACGALLLPGVLHVLAFRAHARLHDFWSLFSTPGLALAAALPCAVALRARAAAVRPFPRRAAGAAAVLLAAACLLAAALGLRDTRDLTRLNATTIHRDIGRQLDALFGPGDVVGTTFLPSLEDVYARATLVGPLTTPAQARQFAQSFAPPAFTGRLAILLPARERDSPLARALADLARREELPNAVLYRFDR